MVIYFYFTVPGSPEFLKITTKSYNSVIISWLPPVKNFVPITGYILYIRYVHAVFFYYRIEIVIPKMYYFLHENLSNISCFLYTFV